jgi:hypothetical protein
VAVVRVIKRADPDWLLAKPALSLPPADPGFEGDDAEDDDVAPEDDDENELSLLSEARPPLTEPTAFLTPDAPLPF